MTRDGLERLVEIANVAFPRGVHFMVSHDARFNDPLVPDDLTRLRAADLSESVLDLAERIGGELPGSAIYFPVPMARALESGVSWRAAVDRYHYSMIVVDPEQQWSWRGRAVAERTKLFFLEHMRFEASIERYVFEYKIHDGWWDKSYLEACVSPFLAVACSKAGGRCQAALASGQTVVVDPDSLRLDDRERLFIQSPTHGELLVSDGERFRILRETTEDLGRVHFFGELRPLRWPEPSEP